MKTAKQIKRQQYRSHGQYAKVNPCYICDKSAGEDYLSDPRTDTIDSNGVSWDDIALCLCPRCSKELASLPDDWAFAIACGSQVAPWLREAKS